ncbi:MAG: FAD-dependent oxidoreductase [Pseudomonadota bacterium]
MTAAENFDPNRTHNPRIAIAGAGPSGLTIARLLRDQGLTNTVLFEASHRIGGKSETVHVGETLSELGTCYTQRGDRLVRQWMREHGLTWSAIDRPEIDGRSFIDYVKEAPGAPLSWQTLQFLRARRTLMKALDKRPDDPAVLAEAAMPVADWLRQRKLHKIERFFYRALVTTGYGYIHDTNVLQAIRWIDQDLILSGVLNDLVMPHQGWSLFWDRFSQDMEIRLETPITAIQRTEDGVQIHTGERAERFDYVICAMPLDTFAALSEPTADEQFVNDGTWWGRFVITLAICEDWYTEEQIRTFASAMDTTAKTSMLISARREGYDAEAGGHIYLLGQIPGTETLAELQEIMREEVQRRGGRMTRVLHQKDWKYYCRYRPEAIRNGLLTRMDTMQGSHRTFYTGSTFSHESVGKIAIFNAALADKIKHQTTNRKAVAAAPVPA